MGRDMIIGFVIGDDENSCFSTEQFLSLLTMKYNMKHQGLRSFTTNIGYMDVSTSVRQLYLKTDNLEQIDEQRMELTESNVKNMHGIHPNEDMYDDEEDEGEMEASFEWIDFMRSTLSDCSIF